MFWNFFVIFNCLLTDKKVYENAICLLNILGDSNTDSKSYVDLELKCDLETLNSAISKFLERHNTTIEELKQDFLDNKLDKFDVLREDFQKIKMLHFKEPSDALVKVNLSSKLPQWFDTLNDDQKKICSRIYELWGTYYKKYETLEDNQKDTYLKFDGNFFVLGGRFNEMYYWDTYWIVIGLVACDLEDEAFNLIKSFVNIIESKGFIPNGTRKYYLNRSQPPFFPHMLFYLYENTENQKIRNFILSKGLDAAIEEHRFFMKVKVTGEETENTFNVYKVHSDKPRFESYKDDLKTYKNSNYNENIYSNIATAAESGWDFSSRWLIDDNLLHTNDIINIVPVDLNAIVLRNEQIIHYFLNIKSNIKGYLLSTYFARQYRDVINCRLTAINNFLWNKNENVWNDFNTKTKKFTDKKFYISNLYPLFWMKDVSKNTIYSILYKYKQELFGFIGGIPVSGKSENEQCNQQWDYPNVWAPYTQLFIEFLLKSDEKELALHAARSFYLSVKDKFLNSGYFFEKYNCENLGKQGDGGEYAVVNGFGWTNGTIVWLIKTFNKELDIEFDHKESYEKIVKYLENKLQTQNEHTETTSN